MDRWHLDGRCALVTGGTKGIGAAIARELLHLGAAVTVVARDPDRVSEQVQQWRDEGWLASGVSADVTTEHGRHESVDAALSAWGRLDILVNNVGTNIRKPSLDFTLNEFDHILKTNLTAAWEMCRLCHPHLRTGERGSIVTIGSVAGTVAMGSGAPYALSKAALDQMTRYLAVEWAPDGIQVNSVNPWYTRTPLAAPVLDNPEKLERIVGRTPNGRIAEPEEVAALVAFLCLPVARHITGQCIAVDGGFLAGTFVL